MSVAAQMELWSAQSSPAAGGPSWSSTERAIDSAFHSAFVAASDLSAGNRASQAASRLRRRPGLMSTSWHSRRALGRGQPPVLRSPAAMTKRPSRRTSRTRGLVPCSVREAATATILSPASRPVPTSGIGGGAALG
jgi:hypothetical protein